MGRVITQKSDYTFKYNCQLRRHGWLRLTPAYSVKLVEELLENDFTSKIILDPFSGTATTGLVSAENGKDSFLYEINPFLIWFGKAKCKKYSENELNKSLLIAQSAIKSIMKNLPNNCWVPNIYNIERWWCSSTLKILAALRKELSELAGEPTINNDESLVWIAFCRLIIETSSAAFNHVSMSFQDDVTTFNIREISVLFMEILEKILESASENPNGSVEVLHFDARNEEQSGRLYDRVITSPPYPNRIS